MALKVVVTPSKAKVSVDTTAGGSQSESAPRVYRTAYNPQAAAAPKTLKPAYNPQSQRVSRIARAQQIAIKKEIVRRREQKQLGLKVSNYKNKLKASVDANPIVGKLKVATGYKPKKIIVPKHVLNPEEEEYQRVKDESKNQAMRLIDQTQNPNIKGFANVWDKISFGSDRRAQKARDEAQRLGEATAETQTRIYEQKLDSHNQLIAGLQADFEKKKRRMSTADLNKLADHYNAKIANSLKDLNHTAAYTEGMLEGYGIKSEQPIKSLAAKSAGWFAKNVIKPATNNNIWKYTLGEGTKNMPSIVTAPSRLVNLIGNLNTKNRQIYKYGGSAANRDNSSENAWQATFNQRNFNIRPTNSKNLYARGANTAVEFAADPLNLIGGASALLKGTKAGRYITKAARAGSKTSWAFKAADKISETKKYFSNRITEAGFFKKLNAEYLSPDEKLQVAIEGAQKMQGKAISTMLPRLSAIQKKLSAGTADLSVFEDLRKLTNSESKILQRMHAGKLTVRDRLLLSGKQYEKTRIKLQEISKKWEDFSESMREVDRVSTTRFGRGKKTYSPHTVWTKDLNNYNFRLFSKNPVQTSENMAQGAVDRYLKSKLIKSNKAGNARLISERDELLKRYDDLVRGARDGVAEAERGTVKLKKYFRAKRSGAKYDNVSLKNAAFNSAKSITGAPTRLWKKSVLKYRPAWTTNNIIYNTQAGMLSGGLRYIPEQLKMLNPKYARKAMDNLPGELKTKIAKETGKGKLSKFYGGVENNPRTAAFNALKKKGFSDEKALKRVNKYFFDYTTKQWERPLKAVLPFWSFQKSLTKAAVQMPFDRPIAATAYNRIERYQKEDFEKQFAPVAQKLKEYGYSDSDIEAIKKEQAVYFAGRLRLGNKHYTLPFNAFSENGLRSFGVNPYIAAAGETANSEDANGNKLTGYQSSLIRRLTTKFPQAELGYKGYKSWRVDNKLDKPRKVYIGKKGSEGYGLTKEQQGSDPSKTNYVPELDPRTKSGQDIARFLGKPHEMVFDKELLLKRKKFEKVSTEYFEKSKDWKNMDFEKSEAQRAKLFKKYGIKPEDFYEGILSKYDSENAKKVKGMKEEARKKNKKLFAEYAKQPKGARNKWAAKKLDELNAAGYFDKNPFLKSFKWLSKDSYERAEKQTIVQEAIRTGNWSTYRKKYGVKSSNFVYKGKHFKSEKTMSAFKEGQFWKKYIEADKVQRRQLLADNPEYNRRADWTDEQWDQWKQEQRKKAYAKAKKYNKTSKSFKYHIVSNRIAAELFMRNRGTKKYQKRVAYS